MKTPVNECEVGWEVWFEDTDREIRGKALCDVGGRAKVGVVGLLPGCNTQPSHYHTVEKEHL